MFIHLKYCYIYITYSAEIRKEIRNLKRGIKNEQNKKIADEKQVTEEKKKKETNSEHIKQYRETTKKYKEESTKLHQKGII